MPALSENTPTESAELLRLVFDHAGEGISIFDDQLRLRAWNARFLQLTGIDPAIAFRGAPLFDLLLNQAQRGEFGDVDAVAEAQARTVSMRHSEAGLTQRLRPNGRCIEVRRNPLPGGGFVMLYNDITERKAADARALGEQRMLALLMQRTEQGFWFIDNALRTTDANPAMCRMLGLSLAQLRGRGIYEFVDEANAKIFRYQVGLRERGQSQGYEISLRRADGSPVHCYNNATPIIDPDGKIQGALGMFTDISRLTRAESQIRHTGVLLQQKSQVLENTLDSLSQGVLSLDASGHANAWNRRFLDLLNIPAELMQTGPSLPALVRYQLDQGDFSDANSPVTAHGPGSLARAMVGDPLALVPLYQRSSPDGSVLEVQTHVAADASVVRTYTDVTASVRSQRALQNSELRFRSMADGAPALIWQAGVDGIPIWFNQRWLGHTGRSMAEELTLPWARRIHPDDLDRCREAFEQAAAHRTAYNVELRLLSASGRTVWIADSGIPLFGPAGEFEGYVGYGWEITARRAAETALLSAKEEAERANRAKSEFLSRMSHELRTPLNAVLGFGQLLERDEVDPLSRAQHGRVQELLRGGRHLLSLINDVLDLARIEAGTLQLTLAAVDVAELVGDCLRLVQPMAAERGITLQVANVANAPSAPSASSAPGASSAWVQADATRLKQVLLNLLSNAIKYNHSGGRVDLSWQAEEGGRQLRIDITDSGPGLSTAQLARLFQAFERLDAERTSVEGAGIGLALSKWLVELMRGHIGVRSLPGQGSTFWLRLQTADAAMGVGVAAGAATGIAARAPALAGSPAAPQQLIPPTPQPGYRVLYIEDNPINQLLMQGMLQQRPAITLHMAGLPEDGLLMAALAPPDLVLLDIQLPQMDGFEVLRRLRLNPATRHIPVVAVSANAMHADIEQARLAGFADYVTKPLDLLRLLAVVDGQLTRLGGSLPLPA